jgi:glutathione S-transferase
MSRMPPFELEMTRFIRAPRENVYDGLVDRDALAAWMWPRGTRASEVTIDAREGGR